MLKHSKTWNYYLVLICLNFILSLSHVYGSQIKIKSIEGSATKLLVNQHQASEAKNGDILSEESSLATEESSKAIISLGSEGILELGPNSQMALTRIDVKNGVKIIDLYSGFLRVSFGGDKEKSSLYVKTRNGLIRVKNATSQIIFNRTDRMTNVLALENEIEVIKINNRNFNSSASSHDYYTNIEKTFDSSEMTTVREGRFTALLESLDKATIAVKISPEQFQTIKEKVGNQNHHLSKKSDLESDEVLDLEDPSPEGFVDNSQNLLAPKAGGMIDFKTGYYIMPDEKSGFDDVNSTYKFTDSGSVDKEDGGYIAPEGLEIVAKNGFIKNREGAGSGDNQDHQGEGDQEGESSFNKRVIRNQNNYLPPLPRFAESGYQPVLPPEKEEPKVDVKEIPNHGFGLDYNVASKKLKLDGKKGISARSGFESDLFYKYFFTEKFDLKFKFGLKNYNFPDTKDIPFKQTRKTLYKYGMGTSYTFWDRLTLSADLSVDGEYVFLSEGNIDIKSVYVPKLGVNLKLIVLKFYGNKISVEIGQNVAKSANGNGAHVKSGYGHIGKLEWQIPFTETSQLKFSAWHAIDKLKTTNNKLRTQTQGGGISYSFSF